MNFTTSSFERMMKQSPGPRLPPRQAAQRLRLIQVPPLLAGPPKICYQLSLQPRGVTLAPLTRRGAIRS